MRMRALFTPRRPSRFDIALEFDPTIPQPRISDVDKKTSSLKITPIFYVRWRSSPDVYLLERRDLPGIVAEKLIRIEESCFTRSIFGGVLGNPEISEAVIVVCDTTFSRRSPRPMTSTPANFRFLVWRSDTPHLTVLLPASVRSNFRPRISESVY
jgi:hypothetical protein